MIGSKTLICGVVAFAALSISAQQDPSDLTTLSLEDLMKIEVTSVSRGPEELSSASAAVTVITGDDIRRYGATTIPEALRLAPGLQVAQVNSHIWAISARGFNDVFANKLLVMIDGRSVYTPLFSGVFWDVQDTLIEDIDRIEVVRGPGATLWGANAVNGVINIITRNAKETQGFLISGGTGSEEIGFGNVRYGGKLNDNIYLRVYAKYFNRDDSKLPSGIDANDRWDMGRSGFRLDWEPSDINTITLQGEAYAGTLNETYTVPTLSAPFVAAIADDYEVNGAHLLGRWSRTFSEESQMSLQVYVDETERNSVVLNQRRDTEDIDFQHQFTLGTRHKAVWGAGFRRTADLTRGTLNVTLNPAHRASELYSAFLQDEIWLVEERLALTFGSKFEHNDFTGFEIQPDAHLLWTPLDRHTIWTSVARAVRTPSQAEDDIQLNMPGGVSIFGNRSFDSEKMIAYEIGYRVQPLARLSIDLAAFYNDYDDLRSLEPTLVPGPGLRASNGLEGETYGFEVAAKLQVTELWRISAGYTGLQMQLHRKSGSLDFSSEASTEKASPHHQVFVRSSLDFLERFEFDSTFRYVDQIVAGGSVMPAYLTMDIRLAWKPSRNLEISLVGQNLFDNQHPEFAPSFVATGQAELERSVYAKLTWRF